MSLSIITEKLNTLLNQSPGGDNRVESNYTDIKIPSFKIITPQGHSSFSIEKGKLLGESPGQEVMNIIDAFYKFSKHTLIREWNQYRPEGSYAIEQIKFDLDIPTTQTLVVSHFEEQSIQPVYEIIYWFEPESQSIKLDFTLLSATLGIAGPMKITYRNMIFFLNNLGPVSNKTVKKLIKKLHAEIINEAVFFAISSNHAKLDLVLFKKFIKEHKPSLIPSDDMDLDEFLPVYERPYTTKRNVPV